MSLDEILAAYEGDDQELRVMIEQRAQLVELQNHPGWQVFRDVIYSRLEPFQKRMMLGKYASLEAYKEEVGFVKGMTEAVNGTLVKVDGWIASRLEQPEDLDGSDLSDAYADDFPAE